MIKTHNIKLAWRNLKKDKTYSALNIIGLSTGMAVTLLIGLWIHYQLSYNRFLPDYEQAYTVKVKYNANGEAGVSPATPFPLAGVMKEEVPGVKYIAQSDWIGPHGLIVGENKIYPSGIMAGEDFLRIFKYPLVKGNPATVLRDTYSIVLSESTARSLFGSADPMNKIVRIDNAHDLKVTGVIKDLPLSSTLQFSYLVPFSFYALNDWVKRDQENWNGNSYQTFFSLEPNASIASVDARLDDIFKKYSSENYKGIDQRPVTHPLTKWHLYNEFENGVATGGFIGYVKMFGVIGILVLIIACINFTNLSTARSEKRAREVGVRKAMGSGRRELIWQFLSESFVIAVIALVVAIGMIQLVMPSFNNLTKSDITIPYTNGFFWLIMIVYVMLTGLLAGSRPAFYLSSFNPVSVLKGTFQTARSASISRKALVVTQFTCSIILVISTIIIYKQIRHAKDRPAGFVADRLMMSDANSELNKNYDALKTDLLSSGVVSNVTKSSNPVTEIWSNTGVEDFEGRISDENPAVAVIGSGDSDYFKTMGMKLLQGRNFKGDLAADSSTVLLNEAAVKLLRFKDPIGQVLTWKSKPNRVTVIGVVKDALMASPYEAARPTVFLFTPGWSNIITYRLSENVSTETAIAKLSPIFNKYSPSVPYLYRFVDDVYAAKFALEVLIGELAGVFAILAIFISCVGLFGLSAYMAEQRKKELGIRKVLGATVAQVWALLSRDFVVLVLISCLIASPIAFYFLAGWLEKFPYRIDINAGVFLIAAALALVITIITISFQAIKAGVTNPVESLRSE